MIRIDEIYNNTFWPWLNKKRPGLRMFFCDPPGRTDPDALFNLSKPGVKEKNYIFFHDQEPIHLDSHQPLFADVLRRNTDLWWPNKPDKFGHCVVSEQGSFVDQLESEYGWTTHYYFFHGWACLDWYRGYDRAFLIPRASERYPTKTFMSPNRIVAGKRDHRVLFLYNVFKNKLDHNWISAPRVCSYENIDISEVAKKYINIYPDIEQVFSSAPLPKLFSGEDTQHMSSCWLTNFTEASDSLVYVPTETVYFGNRLHLTEKTFKAIALEMPFILVAPAGSLEYLKQYGFQTFSSVFDESYDEEVDDFKRIEKVTKLLKELDNLPVHERRQIHQACLPIVEHNYNHFYKGEFENILWKELFKMLVNI